MSKKESLTNKTINGFIWSGTGSIITAVLQIVVLAVLARLIDVESFGVVQAALIVVGFARLASQMGVGPAIVQKKELTDNHIRVAFTMTMILGIILGTTVFLLSNTLASFFKIEELSRVLKFIAFLFVIESFVVISYSLMQREMRFKEIALVDTLSYLLGYGLVSVVLGFLGFDYWALIIAVFSQIIIKAIGLTILRKHAFIPLWKKQEFKELFNYGGGYTLAKIANYFAGQGDNLIIGRYLGAQALGLYGRAYTLMIKPYSLVTNALDQALFPAMSVVQDHKKVLRTNFKKIVKVMSLVCMPLTAIFLVLSKQIVVVLLGEDWIAAVIPLQILSLTIVIRINSRVSDILARAVGKVYSRAWRKIIYGVVMIGSCVVGQRWGLAGVAFAVVFANLLNFILMANLTFRTINIKWKDYLKLYSKSIIVTLFFGLLLYGSRKGFEIITSYHILILFGTLLLAGSLTGLLIIKFKSYFLEDISQYIQQILSKLKLGALNKFLK